MKVGLRLILSPESMIKEEAGETRPVFLAQCFMKKLFLALTVLVLSCSVVFAGGSTEAASGEDDGQYKVALIIENTIDDRGWCQSMHEGILGAMEQLPGKIHYEYSERMTTVDSESIARQYIADGFDLIIALSSEMKSVTDAESAYAFCLSEISSLFDGFANGLQALMYSSVTF